MGIGEHFGTQRRWYSVGQLGGQVADVQGYRAKS